VLVDTVGPNSPQPQIAAASAANIVIAAYTRIPQIWEMLTVSKS
jgi:hypothetical protein